MNGGYGGGGQRLLQAAVAVIIGIIAVSFVAIRGCQEGPFGRKQIVTLSPQQEVQLGLQAYQEVLRQSDVVEGGPVVAEVKDITRRLVRATTNRRLLEMTKIPERDYKWEVRVVRSREVNAFCLPGGKMVVFTGILPVCSTNAGLATVMGHEIAHALGRHGAERMAQQQMAQIGITAAGGALGNMDPQDRDRVLMVLNAGAKFGILRYSRKHESEADHIGLLLMATAGYDPRESVAFWARMREAAGGRQGPPEFLSTHPSHETRIEDLKKWMPQAMELYQGSDQQKTEPLPLRS